MPSQHKHPPVSFRPGTQPGDPEGDRAWLYAYAGRTGRKIGAILSEALAAYRAAHEGTGNGHGSTVPTSMRTRIVQREEQKR